MRAEWPQGCECSSFRRFWGSLKKNSQMICLHLRWIFQPNVGKYTSPMEHMGLIVTPSFLKKTGFWNIILARGVHISKLTGDRWLAPITRGTDNKKHLEGGPCLRGSILCWAWEHSHTVPSWQLTYHIHTRLALSKMIFELSQAGYVSFLEGIWWMSQSHIVHWAESINEVRMDKTLTVDVREASKEPFLISLNWLIDDWCQKWFTWLTCVHVHILVESDV